MSSRAALMIAKHKPTERKAMQYNEVSENQPCEESRLSRILNNLSDRRSHIREMATAVEDLGNPLLGGEPQPPKAVEEKNKKVGTGMMDEIDLSLIDLSDSLKTLQRKLDRLGSL